MPRESEAGFYKSKTFIALASVLVIVVAARLALPHFVQSYVNKVLDENPSYDGHVGDVDIHLWRGAYSVDDIDIVKTEGKSPVPFFKARKVDLSLGWKELFEGAISARIKFYEPEINFVDSKNPKAKQSGEDADWGQTLDKLVPFNISRLEIENGSAHFRNYQADPPVDMWLTHLDVTVRNLTNSKDENQDLFASCDATGVALGGGKLDLGLKLNPRAKKPTFELQAKLLGIDLKALNPFFKKYAKLDFSSGRGDIVTEIGASNGTLRGYVKPLLKNIDVLSIKDDIEKDHDNILQVIWEGLAGTIVQLFKNQPKDQLATEIPITGSMEAPTTGIFPAIGGVLRNAFIQAFTPFYRSSFKSSKG